MTDKKVNVALYARVSTKGHGQDVGLQLDDLRAFVASNRNWHVADEYVDVGESGTKASRPQLDRLMADVRKHKLDVVVVWRFDRWARSTSHLLESLHEFQHLSVDFVSLREAINTSTPIGKMVFTLTAALAEFERSLIVERVQSGVDRAKAAGKHCGRPKVDMDLRPALALIRQGRGLKSVAKMLGVSRTTLRCRLSEVGAWQAQAQQSDGQGLATDPVA